MRVANLKTLAWLLAVCAVGGAHAETPAEQGNRDPRLDWFFPKDESCSEVRPWLEPALRMIRARRPDDGILAIERALLHAPDCSSAYVALGDALILKRAWSEALTQYRQGIERGFADSFIHVSIGICLLHLNRVDEAITSLELADSKGIRDIDLFGNLAWAYNQKHRFASAVEYGLKSLALVPEQADVLQNLGISLEELGRHTDAISIYDRSIALKPDDAEAHYNRGVALMRNRELDRAIADFSAAATLDPRMADAYVLRGESKCRRGDAQTAQPDYERALAVNPKHDDAKWLLRHLDLCRPELIHELESRP